MGVTSKPVGTMRSIMRKLDNELLKKAQEEKEKRESKNSKKNK